MFPEINIPEDKETNTQVSLIIDPFVKDSLKSVSINYMKSSFNDSSYWYARLSFENGATKGEQKIDNCPSFEEIVVKVKQILDEVKNKSI